MSQVCRFCGKTEIVFDNAFKSSSGKMIPLDKQSGMPHQRSQSSYAKQHQQQQQQQQSQPQQGQPKQQGQGSTTVITQATQNDIIIKKLDRLQNTVDLLTNLIHTQREQEQLQK
jgi:hypothetical protein